jgi:SEC-C motif
VAEKQKKPPIETADDEFCPCGSSRKWKKCHGAEDFHEHPIVDFVDVDPTLLGFANNAIAVLKDAIEAVARPLSD